MSEAEFDARGRRILSVGQQKRLEEDRMLKGIRLSSPFPCVYETGLGKRNFRVPPGEVWQIHSIVATHTCDLYVQSIAISMVWRYRIDPRQRYGLPLASVSGRDNIFRFGTATDADFIDIEILNAGARIENLDIALYGNLYKH